MRHTSPKMATTPSTTTIPIPPLPIAKGGSLSALAMGDFPTATSQQPTAFSPQNTKTANGDSPSTAAFSFLTLYFQNTKPRGVKRALFRNLYLPRFDRLTAKNVIFAY